MYNLKFLNNSSIVKIIDIIRTKFLWSKLLIKSPILISLIFLPLVLKKTKELDSCNNSHDTLRIRVPCSRRKAIIYTAFIFIKINAKQWTRGGADSGQPRDLHEDMYTRSNKWNGKKMEKQEGDGKR